MNVDLAPAWTILGIGLVVSCLAYTALVALLGRLLRKRGSAWRWLLLALALGVLAGWLAGVLLRRSGRGKRE